MKLADIDKVNRLVVALEEIRQLIRMAERAEASLFQLFIESPGDSSLKMSREGASTPHAGGIAVSADFLEQLKQLALVELHVKQDAVLADLTVLGVDTAAP